ncbi:MAG: transcription termination/antitermination protein NusA, partial [Clostridiales bacterium]|nr:transcription termination/antitermination protein NusA [Clostridiales bacterium]
MRTKKSAAAAKPQTSELVEAIKMLASEKSISEEMLFSTVEDALKKAYQKNLPNGVLVPSPNNITATIDRMTGEVHVYTRRLIVEEIETPT